MYPNTKSSKIILIFVLIQFCNIIFIISSHHTCYSIIILIFVLIQFCNIILIFSYISIIICIFVNQHYFIFILCLFSHILICG